MNESCRATTLQLYCKVDVMNLPVNPAKVLRLFAPLWLLLALSLSLAWSAWQSKPLMLAAIALTPIAAAIAAGLMRERWRLELSRDGLIHRTLGRTEHFEWARMGPLQLRSGRVSELLFVRTFWFAFPTDAPRNAGEHASQALGRRILCVFGDHSVVQTIRQIEDWRALYAAK